MYTDRQKAQWVYDFWIGDKQAPIETRRVVNVNVHKDLPSEDDMSWQPVRELFDYDGLKFSRAYFDFKYLHDHMELVKEI